LRGWSNVREDKLRSHQKNAFRKNVTLERFDKIGVLKEVVAPFTINLSTDYITLRRRHTEKSFTGSERYLVRSRASLCWPRSVKIDCPTASLSKAVWCDLYWILKIRWHFKYKEKTQTLILQVGRWAGLEVHRKR
jgi:hypothetical protein